MPLDHTDSLLNNLRRFQLKGSSSDEFIIKFLKTLRVYDFGNKANITQVTAFFEHPKTLIPDAEEITNPERGKFKTEIYFQMSVTYKFLEIRYSKLFENTPYEEGKKTLEKKCHTFFNFSFSAYHDEKYHYFNWHLGFFILHAILAILLIFLKIFIKTFSLLLFLFLFFFVLLGLAINLIWVFVMKDESKNPSSNQNQTITQVEHGDDFQLSLIDPHEPNSFPEENTKISDEDASTQNRHLPETQKSKFEAYMNFIEYFVQPLLDRLFLTFLDFLVVPVAQMCMKLLLFSKTKCEDNQYYSINQSVNSIFDFMFLHQSECTSCSNITTQICLQVCSGHSFYSLKEYEGFRYSTDVIAPSILNFIFGLLISLGIIYYIFRLNQNNIRLIKTLPVIGRLEKFKWYNLLACIESNFLAFLSVFKYKCEDYYIYQIFLRLLFSSVYSFYAEFPRVIVAINFFINIAQIVVLLKLRPYRCFLNFYFELVSYGFSTVITLYSFIYFFFRIPPIIEYIILSCLFLPLLFAFILKLWFKKNMTETPDGELVQTKSVCYKCKYVDKFTSENNINEMKNKDGKKAPLGFCLCRRNLALHNLPDFSVFEGQDPPNYELYDIDFCSNRDPHQKVFPVTTEKFDTSKFQELYQFVERFIESKSIIDIFQFLRGITLLGIVISSWYFGAIYGTHQQRLDLKC